MSAGHMKIRREIPKEVWADLEFYMGRNGKENRAGTDVDMVRLMNLYHHWLGVMDHWEKVGVDESKGVVLVRGIVDMRHPPIQSRLV